MAYNLDIVHLDSVQLNGSPCLATVVNVAANYRGGDDATMFGGIDNPDTNSRRISLTNSAKAAVKVASLTTKAD